MWDSSLRSYLKGIFLLCILLQSLQAAGQARDTLRIYKKIKKIAYRHKSTALLYQSIFVDPAPKKYEDKPLSNKQQKSDPNAAYVGMIIRDVKVVVYDPFGHSVNDTSTRVINDVQKVGNHYHIKTRARIVRNRLLFEPGDTVQLFKITESERLLREARYVNDARIIIEGTGFGSDSVDVTVLVHDKWSLDVDGGVAGDGGYVRFRERNIGGLGQTYEQRVGYYLSTLYDIRGNYNISNIRNSYISSDIFYNTTKEVTQVGISFDRPFYSPLARWAGGVSGSRSWSTYKYTDTVEPLNRSLPLNFYNYDAWLARSFSLGDSKNKSSNIIVALRYAQTTFLLRPSFDIDLAKSNVDQALYLGSLGYSVRKYYKDQYIYRFGANEDIPEGFLAQWVYGLLDREILGARFYSGFELSAGKHFDNFGYISANTVYGTYFKQSVTNDATLNANVYYFSDLGRRYRWYFRQFSTVKYVNGINKSPYERITLNASEMYGFNPGTLNGTEKLLLNLETVAYAPYNLIGFKFAPIVQIGLGMLQTDNNTLFRSKIYQGYTIGMLLRNENLLNSSFEFTVGFYPNQPDSGASTVKLNPVASFTLKVRSFTTAKPDTVGYE